MTSPGNQNPGAATSAEWLQRHRRRFLQGLSDQGYARDTLRSYDRAIVHFCAAVEKRGLGDGDLEAKQIVRLRSAVLDDVRPSVRTNAKFCLDRFIGHLVFALWDGRDGPALAQTIAAFRGTAKRASRRGDHPHFPSPTSAIGFTLCTHLGG